MKILQIKTHSVRNLLDIHIEPTAHFNLLYGANGSGKTSFLESIYLLSRGRSFRGAALNSLIQYEQNVLNTAIRAVDIHDTHYLIGAEKSRNTTLKLKINSETVSSLADIAQVLPTQIICPDSFKLLTDGPQGRRRFLDWGVFHVEHSFFPVWLQYNRALSQRNSLLKQQKNHLNTMQIMAQLHAWDEELSLLGERLTIYRKNYIERFFCILKRKLKKLLPLPELELSYYQGWNEHQTLKEALQASLEGDRKVGFTRVGPQRADIILKMHHYLAADSLSRGQQKILICALILAQGEFVFESTQKRCIYLIDDLASELDATRRHQVLEDMALLHSQIFMTAIEPEPLKECLKQWDYQMFHVKHGQISPCSRSANLK